MAYAIAGKADAGKIVVNHDDWTLSDFGFSRAPDAGQFALNVGNWFTGGSTGNFLVYSRYFSLTGSQLSTIMTNAGHSWTVSTSVDTSLSNLLQYDGIFTEYVFDSDVLISYVQAGGNVYLVAGTTSTPGVIAANFNPFLNPFGLNLASALNGVVGTVPTTSSHSLLTGVQSLYYDNDNFVSELDPSNPHTDILEYYNSGGMIAIYGGDTRTTAYNVMLAYQSDIELLREYRDKVLTKTTRGRVYKYLLYRNSMEALKVFRDNPELMIEARDLIEANKDAVSEVLAGEEGVIYNTDEILSFLKAYAEKSPPALKFWARMVKWQMLKNQRQSKPFLGFRLE